MTTKEKYDFWVKHADDKIAEQLKNMSQKQIEESFHSELTFGTAGIREVMGPGTSRFNKYTIIKATYGFAKYILKNTSKKEPLVIIGSDNRYQHKEFIRISSEILSSFGIRVLSKAIIPTPLISFLVIDKNADGAINITASHNSKEYNGYKVYNSNGGQLLPEEADMVTKFSNEREEWLTYKWEPQEKIIQEISDESITKYLNKVKSIELNKVAPIRISYSPQHGAGSEYLPRVLSEIGHTMFNVKEQMNHDPAFGGTKSANPESPLAYELPIKYAIDNNCDIAIVNDPDADRLGVAAKNENGEFKHLSGNQLAAITLHYLVKNIKGDKGNKYVASSFVSSHLGKMICQKNNIEHIEVATGFKWIADAYKKIKEKEYLFGYEESYGSLIDPNIALDKDALQASMLAAEIASKLKDENKSLWDYLYEIFDEYQWFKEETLKITFEGANSIQERNDFMLKLRSSAQEMFPGVTIEDLSKGKGSVQPMNLLKFIWKDGSWVCVRPSGTEPIIKFYIVAVGSSKVEVKEREEDIKKIVKKMQRI